jgi:hypothetical protein
MVPPGPETLSDVLVIHRTDLGWFCEIDDRRVFIAQLQVEPGTNMPVEGRRGSITIASHAVDQIREAIRHAGRRS